MKLSTTMEELEKKYADRNLKEELAWVRDNLGCGYINLELAKFIRWICGKALTLIREYEANEK